MKDIIEKFEKETGYRLRVENGRLYYNYNIHLEGSEITSLPNNLTVGGCLLLPGTGIASLPDNLTVRGALNISGTGITSLPDNLTVGDYLDIRDTGITSLPDNLTIGGHLYLRGSKIKSLPDNLTIGGCLDLRDTGITSLPDNLTVGKSLDISGTCITSLPDNLIVGGYLDISGTGITKTSKIKKDAPTLYQWRNNKYIKCDGIFNEVISHHGNVYKVKDIGETKEYYLVGDGNGKWAHGDTIEEARKDLMYKISNRDKTKYKGLTLDSVLSYEEAIECYRVITGACLVGTKGFCENELTEKKEHYSIKEVISLTEGKYGNVEFKKFFHDK